MMKKLFAILLALCLMLSLCAVAEEIEYPIVEEYDWDEDGVIDGRMYTSEDYLYLRTEEYYNGILESVKYYDNLINDYTRKEWYDEDGLYAYDVYEHFDDAPEGYDRVCIMYSYDPEDTLTEYDVCLQITDENGNFRNVCVSRYYPDGTLFEQRYILWDEDFFTSYIFIFDGEGNCINAYDTGYEGEVPDASSIVFPDYEFTLEN